MSAKNPLRWIRSVRNDRWSVVSLRHGRISRIAVERRKGSAPVVLGLELDSYKGTDLDALARLRRQGNLGRFRGATLLALGEYQMLQVEPPQVPEGELREAIKWSVKGMIEFPVEEATIDVLPVPTQEGRNPSVFAVCAPNREIERVVRLYQEARVPLELIDIPETAQRNIASHFELEGRGVAMVAFYPEGGLLTFSAGGELYSARRFEISLTQLTEAAESERQYLYERILLELQRSLDTFEHQYHFVSIAKLLVSPLPTEVDLRDYLSANLYLPVETADLAPIIDFSQVPELKDPAIQARLLPLIGVALRDETEPS